MTLKQKIIQFIYPFFMKLSAMKDKNSGIRANKIRAVASESFYSLQAALINNSVFDFHTLKGKKVLLVNLASDCGFTPQYQELEKLSLIYQSNLVVLGFPANDFHGQEPDSDAEIENFCRKNYNVSFYLFKKGSVLQPDRQQVFEWLCNRAKNGWNDMPPSWNFSKYLVDENGNLQYIFKPSISPLNVEVLKAIETPVSSKRLMEVDDIPKSSLAG